MILKEFDLIEDRQARIDFLKAHKAEILKAKRSEVKTSAPVYFPSVPVYSGDVTKEMPEAEKASRRKGFDIVANSCGFMDHHLDVSIPGSFNKTASEGAKKAPVLKDHWHSVEGVIGKNLGVAVKMVPIKELGYDKDGEAEVLAFTIDPVYDEKCRTLYAAGEIKQHSIGLQYVKVEACINDPDDKEGFANWQKYIGQVINREVAEDAGLFFAVLEQKVFEVSAVLFGSNMYTPTLNNNKHSLNNSEPSADTQDKGEPRPDEGKSLVLEGNTLASIFKNLVNSGQREIDAGT